ncbi:hypothetical protein FRC12_002004 [Ceratobasidium sp. 428]|nr:hypothetical protein FRC12_002004 [Ceratobasidium sp. 428]
MKMFQSKQLKSTAFAVPPPVLISSPPLTSTRLNLTSSSPTPAPRATSPVSCTSKRPGRQETLPDNANYAPESLEYKTCSTPYEEREGQRGGLVSTKTTKVWVPSKYPGVNLLNFELIFSFERLLSHSLFIIRFCYLFPPLDITASPPKSTE